MTSYLRMIGFIVPVALALSLAASQSWAQGYVGASVGSANVKKSALCTAEELTCDDSDTAFKLYGGYYINENLLAEFGFAKLGKVGSLPGVGEELTSSTHDFSITGAAVLSFPAGDFSFFGKAGGHYWRGSKTELGQSVKDSGFGGLVGLGVQYEISGAMGVRLEYEAFLVDKAIFKANRMDLISLGLVMRF
ncbi:MAG: outer membrane beta-barrel protein [Paracoccaceae bacterium]|nr:outer membrane beta-barrel protein [Paracoccaceae bacterium]